MGKTKYNKSNKFQFTGLYFNILFAIYFFTLGPVIKEAVEYGSKNILLGLVGLTFYIAEAWFIRVKTTYVLKRAHEFYLHQIQKYNPEAEKERVGGFIFYNILCRFIFRIGAFMVSMMFFGLFDPNSNKQSWIFGTLMVITIIVEVIEMLTYSNLSGAFVNVSKKKGDDDKFNKMIDSKYDKFNRSKYPFLTNETVANVVLFFYSCMVFTALWDFLTTDILNSIEGFYNDGISIYVSAPIFLFQYLVLFAFALIPIRMAYWIEESVMAYGKQGRWKLFMSYAATCLALMLPAILKMLELYL